MNRARNLLLLILSMLSALLLTASASTQDPILSIQVKREVHFVPILFAKVESFNCVLRSLVRPLQVALTRATHDRVEARK